MYKFFTILSLIVLSLSLNAEPNIKLLPHQLEPIRYLQKNPDIPGLLINHYMGTGKTYLAVGLGEAFPEQDIVIIAPRFISGHWDKHLQSYGVVDAKRYQFMSYQDAPKLLLKRDLSKTIVILDECHNLVTFIHSPAAELNKQYSDLYIHLQSAHKIIGMSGTLVYGEAIDISFLINLVSRAELLPYNTEEFRMNYMTIKPWTSFFRGHVSESMILQSTLPTTTALFALVATNFNMLAGLPALVIGTIALPVTNSLWPVTPFIFRELDSEKFKLLASKYVSFYEINQENFADFPTKRISVENITYSDEQFDFFLDFAQNSLSTDNLMRILDYQNRQYVALNSTDIQIKLQSLTGSGREIGNLSFTEAAPKFEQILKKFVAEGMPQTVIYSNYYKNGIEAIAHFFDGKGLKEKYAILLPTASSNEQSRIIDDYNTGKTKILLLHPEITEGISLIGTRHMHIMEPVLSNTALDQIVGRTVRYRSHNHLPANKRRVDVYLWKAEVPRMSIWTYSAKKRDWWKRYSELSDWSQWGGGIRQVDTFFDRKLYSPDALAYMRVKHLDASVESLKNILRDNSIESSTAASLKN